MRPSSLTNWALIQLGFLSLLAIADYTPPPHLAAVNLRIEGATSTIFEGWLVTQAHDVTTSSGGTHKCDGTNNGQNPSAGPTLTGALDSAAQLKGFTWDGDWYASFEDYFISRIDTTSNSATQFWGLLKGAGKGWVYTDVGGCQERVVNGESLLIAYDAFNAQEFLRLSSEKYLAKVGKPVTVMVTNGTGLAPVQGAVVGGQTTGADGKVTLTFGEAGVKRLKAEKTGAIRSNEIVVVVGGH